jgi:OHCU decarboxylase
MAKARPFRLVEDLLQCAEKKWFALPPADWLEAYAAHPKIGAGKGAPSQKRQSAKWSKGEQAGVTTADANTKAKLAELNGLYEQKFGFIFIVCATGKTAEEMLAICKARLGNSVETELRLAAVEQQKITEIRLTKLLEK